MILVDELTIEEFRGIRNLTLKLNGKNFAVCGPNGTGKSGIVDALEFGLTGNISRLSGGGTGAITLKKHAPHVDYRDNPEKAKVKLTIRIPSLKNKRVTIARNVKDANSPVISPGTPDVLGVLTQLENHPEFVLSRRELIAYVLAAPGKRSEEIQALLQLNKIGELRATLLKISNTCKKESELLQNAVSAASQNLAKALEIPELKTDKLIEAVNIRRRVLGLPEIETLTATTNLIDGLQTSAKAAAPKVIKVQATADLKIASDLITKLTSSPLQEIRTALLKEVGELSENSAVADGILKEQFLKRAIALVTEDKCPVCGTGWKVDDLKGLIQAKLNGFEEANKLRVKFETNTTPVISLLQQLSNAVDAVERLAKELKLEKASIFGTYRNDLAKKIKTLQTILPLTDTTTVIENVTKIPTEFAEQLQDLGRTITELPEPNEQETARDFLVLSNDRLAQWREAARSAKKAKDQSAFATTIHDVYVDESNKSLENVYKEVEREFATFYQLINSDDEESFSAKLTPSMGKLGFDVEFYGRGHFPPGAYHSEGHQDGMGLCLYLALMQRLQGSSFTFAVLDDVLMSVDTGHRREVCSLLKSKFPNTQFVLTTHDEVWLKHMSSAGLVESSKSVRFSNWTPEIGPTEWANRDVWREIDEALAKENVREAASLLRYYLEHISKEICHNLRASVEFKGDGRYDLGDLLPPAVKRFRGLLSDGQKAAISWGKTEINDQLIAKEKVVATCFQESNADQWQVNPAIHYNEWANLTTSDFRPVVKAFRDLTGIFFCQEEGCKSLYYLTFTTPKELSAIRCACGNLDADLKKRKPLGA